MNDFDYAGALAEFRRLTGTGALKAANLILADLLDALVQRAAVPMIKNAAEMVSYQAHAPDRVAIPFCQIVEAQHEAAAPLDEPDEDQPDDESEDEPDSPGVSIDGGPRKRRPRSPPGVHRPRMTAAERALLNGE